MCPWKWHPFLVDINYDYLGAQQPRLTLLTSEEAFLAPFPPPPSPFTLAKKRNEKTFQLWPLKLATFPKKISGNILGKFGLCQIIQQYDARLRQIKLCPKAGNDEYIVLSNFISCSMSGFEVIEEALWSPSVTRSERKKKKKDPCESG